MPYFPIKVLYIDGDGPLGGASRSLFEAIRGLPEGSVDPYFVVSRGTASVFYQQVAKDIITTRGMSKFDNTRYGYYRSLRWVILLREFFHFPFMIWALFAARLRWKRFDIIHVNEFVYIIPGLIAKKLFGAQLVVHVRALARYRDNSSRTRWMGKIFSRAVDAVIAIDGNVRATLPHELTVDIINNSFTPKLESQPESEFVDKIASIRKDSLKVGFVGNIHRSKGIFEIFEAAKIVRRSGRIVDFLIVGGVTIEDRGLRAWVLSKLGFAQNAQADLAKSVEEAGLGDCFHLLGPTLEIKYLYDRIDVLLFPSHFDAPGRPVFEAGFSAVPSIVAVANPTPDTFIHGETGLAIHARCPDELAEAILYFAESPEEVRRMGENARQLAMSNFDPQKNSKKLLDLYTRVLRCSKREATDNSSMPR